MKKLALYGVLGLSVLAIPFLLVRSIPHEEAVTSVESEQLSSASQQLVVTDPVTPSVKTPPAPEVQVVVSSLHRNTKPTAPPAITPATPTESEQQLIAAYHKAQQGELPSEPMIVETRITPKKHVRPDPPKVEEERPVTRPVEISREIARRPESSQRKLQREIEENRAWRRAKLAEWAREEARRRNGG